MRKPIIKTVIIQDSNRKNKRFEAILLDEYGDEKKRVHFGLWPYKGHGAFPDHKRRDLQKAYIARHIKNEDWDNLKTSGTWARWLLWGRDNFNDAIKNMETRFKINIIRRGQRIRKL